MRKRSFATPALLLCIAISGCRKQEEHAPSTAAPQVDKFDLKSHADALVVKPVDPATLTPSQRQFGIAPRRDPKVEYQPDIILMEQGDTAIRSIASDGIRWTFDANAPHVNEFAMGKIVFATGRAVGRIAMLKREGDNVQVILMPVKFTDLIAKGSFAMDSGLDLDKMIPYVYPDFPQPKDSDGKQASILPLPGVDGWKGTIVVSRVSRRNHWTPVNMTTVAEDGSRERFERVRGRWSSIPSYTQPYLAGSQGYEPSPRMVRASYQAPFRMPGVGGPQITPPKIPDFNPPTVPNLPPVNIQDLVPGVVASSDGIGVKYTYEKNGITVVATGLLTFSGAHAKTFLVLNGGVLPKECGIELGGVVGVRMHLKAHTEQDWHINIQKKMFLPISFSIPISGPVPFALSFEQGLVLNTGFSAKTSVLNADGRYDVHGALKAGYFDGGWGAKPDLSVTKKVSIGDSTEGISVGINSLLMGSELRVMFGLGQGAFNFGVYALMVYTGTLLRAPDIGLPCRQGTMNMVLKSGLGYSLPQFVVDAVNYVLSFFTTDRLDSSGTILHGPEVPLLNERVEVPTGCSG